MNENENAAPKTACIFNEHNVFQFAQAAGDKVGSFEIVGYSGKIIKDHWYWGNLAFDLGGMKFAKTRTPVLEEHFTSRRLGFTTKQQIEDNVTVEGQFLANDPANQMATDIKSGFPMEASLYIQPSVIERIDDGESVEVNTLQLKGPGTVFRKSTIKEVSMCVFGADSNTKSVAAADRDNQIVFTDVNKEQFIMADKKETKELTVADMTAETFAAARPKLHEAIVDTAHAEGVEAERGRFAELKEACGDDHELTVQCFAGHNSVTEALKMRIAQGEQRIDEQSKQLASARKKDIDPADSEFSDESTLQNEEKFDDSKATDEQLAEHFAKTQELQDQFRDGQSYVAYIKHDVRGK